MSINKLFKVKENTAEKAKLAHITINGTELDVEQGTTILEAAKKAGVNIPTLCYLKLDAIGYCNQPSACRVCMVEVEGLGKLVTACSEKVRDGMVVHTDSPKAVRGRRTALELLLSNHPKACLTCPKNLECELQSLAHEMAIKDIPYKGKLMNHERDNTSRAISKDPNKCIMCRRCETMCNKIQTVGVYSALNRGFDTVVGTAFQLNMGDSSCTFCGQCLAVCPTGALTEIDETAKVWRALHNPDKHVVVQVAPAVRVAVGELFGMAPGTIVTGKLVRALRLLGFDAVFDTDWGADLTVIEEAKELADRIATGKNLPILTSCCPAWVTFIETQFPDMLNIPSTCRSPQMMTGAMIKTYYAEKNHIKPEDIVVVSVMPCVAKKAEAARPELSVNHDMQDVDIVVSTRELGSMLNQIGIDMANLQDDDFDQLLGETTGASVIFGTTGGVIEAAIRTAADWLTGESLDKIEFNELRGFEGIRSAEVTFGEYKLNVGIAHGLGNARKLLEGIRDGKFHFDAIEIMACPGGCVGGGGQPYHHGNMDIIQRRREGLYREDRNKPLRKSHENPTIAKLYEEYLGEPAGEKAHHLLHTEYKKRQRI